MRQKMGIHYRNQVSMDAKEIITDENIGRGSKGRSKEKEQNKIEINKESQGEEIKWIRWETKEIKHE